MRSFFSIDDIYNAQNTRMWTVNRADANKSGIQQKRNFPQKVMV